MLRLKWNSKRKFISERDLTETDSQWQIVSPRKKEEKWLRSPPMLSRPHLRKNALLLSKAMPGSVKSMKTVELLLKYVVEGEQNKAKALLESNAELALQKGNVTDLSKREFRSITGFQYTLWALDWHMGKMLLEYLPKEAAALQWAEWEAKETIYGKQFSLAPLIEALNTYAQHYHEWNSSKCQRYWCEVVGRNQWLLPVHVVNEYCHPIRTFYPCPTFDEEMLPRSRICEAGEWYTGMSNRGKLGDTFGVMRSCFKRAEVWHLLYWSAEGAEIDARALENLWKMRQQQIERLKLALTDQRELTTRQQIEEALSLQEAQNALQHKIKREAHFYLGEKEHVANKDYLLGVCYQRGCGVLADQKKSVKYLQRAAQAGHPRACYYLGRMYKYGEGVLQDKNHAKDLFEACIEAIKEQAHSKEDGWGAFVLGSMYEDGDGISENKEEASYWYQISLPWLCKIAEQGHVVAQISLGFCYRNGLGVEKDEKRAVSWYQKAAEQGHPVAQYNLGFCYENGQGVRKDEKAAVAWYRKAAEQGHALAQVQLKHRSGCFLSSSTPLTDFFAVPGQKKLGATLSTSSLATQNYKPR
jgi:TPR repeat protein